MINLTAIILLITTITVLGHPHRTGWIDEPMTGGFTPLDVESPEVKEMIRIVENTRAGEGIHPRFMVKCVGVDSADYQIVSGGKRYKLKLHLTLLECKSPHSDCRRMPVNVSRATLQEDQPVT